MEYYSDKEQKEIFSSNLKQLIRMSGKEQKDIAADLNVNPPTFSQWATGKTIPSPSKLRMIANYFHVSISDLVNKHYDVNLGELLFKDKKIHTSNERETKADISTIMDLVNKLETEFAELKESYKNLYSSIRDLPELSEDDIEILLAYRNKSIIEKNVIRGALGLSPLKEETI